MITVNVTIIDAPGGGGGPGGGGVTPEKLSNKNAKKNKKVKTKDPPNIF